VRAIHGPHPPLRCGLRACALRDGLFPTIHSSPWRPTLS